MLFKTTNYHSYWSSHTAALPFLESAVFHLEPPQVAPVGTARRSVGYLVAFPPSRSKCGDDHASKPAQRGHVQTVPNTTYLITLAAAFALMLHGPIEQLRLYHAFADQTQLLGIPHLLNALKNFSIKILRKQCGTYRKFNP